MRDLQELADWLQAKEELAHSPLSDTLPEPSFRANGRRMVSFSTNNYLALATSPRMKARARQALDEYGVGNCESRLLGGNLELYEALEARLAAIKKKPAAMLFATGYLTNLGVLPSLARTGTLARVMGYRPRQQWKHAFFSDEFNHLSIREGLRMSDAAVTSFRHADMNDLERRLVASTASIKIIVTDGVFSQHGDIARLPDMCELAERYDAVIYIDDAHGTGVLGPTGAGTSEHFNIESERIIHMGTLSKAYGCIGGFIATDASVAAVLRAGCSAYGFTSTLPPDQAAAVLEAIDMVVDEPERRERLWSNQRYMIRRFAEMGMTFECTDSAILPLVVGDEQSCKHLSHGLLEEGIHVDPIMFPAVPRGQSRLRFIANAHHTVADMDHLASAVQELWAPVRAV